MMAMGREKSFWVLMPPEFHYLDSLFLPDLARARLLAQIALAIEDAIKFDAFSSEYITNILEQRLCPTKEPGVLHVTRSSDLLNITIDRPDMSVYSIGGKND